MEQSFQKGTVLNLSPQHSKWRMRNASHRLVLFFIVTEARSIPPIDSSSSYISTM